MKYVLYPIYAILVILLTLFEIISNSLIWITQVIWNLKLPKNGWNWKELHINDMSITNIYRNNINTGIRIQQGWDNTILETLHRRLTFGDYKHKD